MKVVGLISGGKDSCYSLLECIQYGHEIIAVASIHPPEQIEECDSFMFQTIGVGQICPLIAQCIGVPLISIPLKGKSLCTTLEYSKNGLDEVEDLFQLLSIVKEKFPEVQAVCSGAVLSNYQRIRVEHVCDRLQLTSLAYLWKRDQSEVLNSMISDGVDAVIVKIASMGLTENMLGKSIDSLNEKFHEL